MILLMKVKRVLQIRKKERNVKPKEKKKKREGNKLYGPVGCMAYSPELV
jgi:hypothetical protein